MTILGIVGDHHGDGGDMFRVAGDMFCSDGGKTMSTPSPNNLYWTVRLDWSWTILSQPKYIPACRSLTFL